MSSAYRRPQLVAASVPMAGPGNMVAELPPEEPATLIVTPPDGYEQVDAGGIGDILRTIPSLATAAQDLDSTWGQIRDLNGQEDPDPQPTQKSLTGERPTPAKLLGIGLGGILAALLAAVGIYWAGGNLAWALVGGGFVAVLVAWFMG